MLPRSASRIAALGACTLLAAALANPAAAAAVPRSAAIGALGAAGGSAYSAFSTGDILYANAANLPPVDVAKASTGQSAAGVAIGSALTTKDQLKQPLLKAAQAGKTAYGHSAGVNVGLLGGLSDPPQVAETLVEATSPEPSAKSGSAGSIPAAPVLTAEILPGSAAANTTADGSCVIGKDISRANARVANATVVDAGAAAVVGVLGGTSETTSHTKLIAPTKADGSVVNSGKSGLLGETTLTLAPLTLFKGTPLEVKIEVLKDIRLSAAAGGVSGTSVVSYGAVGAINTTPVVKLTIGGQTQTLTSQQVFGDKGIVLALGVADIVIGAPAHSLTGLERTPVTQAPDGTSASAAADFVRVTVPGKLPVPTADPFSGPLAPLNAALNPVLSGAAAALGPIRDALAGAGLNLADVRQGHLEASSTVPVGGIDCATDNNPLDESMKDVSALNVAPGATFDYDVRIPNRGSSPVTNVKVVDTYTAGLQFVSSVPAPASSSGNTLTYELGTIAPNDFKIIVLTFRVPTDAAAGTKYHNSAVITGTYNGQPITKTVDVDGPTVGPVRVGDCNLSGSTKFASNLRVKTGETFGYFINVLNSGGQPCVDVDVSDTLISGVSFLSCTAGCTNSGQVVNWKLGTFAPGESRVLSVLVKVTATSGRLPNTALVTSPSGQGGQPSTPGPLVTDVSQVSPGNPADGPNGLLPRTGLPAGPATLGLAMLIGTAVLLRRRAIS